MKLNNDTRQNNRLNCIKVITFIEFLDIVALTVLNEMSFNSCIESFHFIEATTFLRTCTIGTHQSRVERRVSALALKI